VKAYSIVTIRESIITLYDMGDTADVSEVSAASILSSKLCSLVRFCVYIALYFEKEKGAGLRWSGDWCFIWVCSDNAPGKLCRRPF
jgi:hypothetical protein